VKHLKVKIHAITILTVILLSVVPLGLVQAKGKPFVPNYYVIFTLANRVPFGWGDLLVTSNFNSMKSDTNGYTMDLSFTEKGFGIVTGTLTIDRVYHGSPYNRYEWVIFFEFYSGGTRCFVQVMGDLIKNSKQGRFSITPLYYDAPIGVFRICVWSDYPYTYMYTGTPDFTVTGTTL
jgi:hypothetical protein